MHNYLLYDRFYWESNGNSTISSKVIYKKTFPSWPFIVWIEDNKTCYGQFNALPSCVASPYWRMLFPLGLFLEYMLRQIIALTAQAWMFPIDFSTSIGEKHGAHFCCIKPLILNHAAHCLFLECQYFITTC